MTRIPISDGELFAESIAVKRSHSSR